MQFVASSLRLARQLLALPGVARATRSNRMRPATTNLGRLIIGFALLAFLLPFATVGCGAPKGYGSIGDGVTAQYRGVTLALGGAPELRAPDGSPASSAATAEDLSPP